MFRLDGDHEALRAVVRRVVEKGVAPYAAAVDEEGRFPVEGLAALTGNGLHAIGIPEAYGGQGGDLLASVVVAEEVARACTTTQQVAGGYELFATPVLLAGSEVQRRRWLPRIASGEALGAFALSEPEAGSDVAAMRTQAVMDGEDWVLTGTKRWITNAGVAGLYVVFAVTGPGAGSRGISAFVVEADDPGLSFGAPERKMGLRGSPTREVYLDRVRLPADRLLGEPGSGLGTALSTLDRTRSVVAAQAVGIAQGALDVAAAYAGERRQFGQRIGDFQGVGFMLADMEIKVRAARLLTYAAAAEAECDGPDLSVAGAAA